MKAKAPPPGPIEFTAQEIFEARNGNYASIEKRLRRELGARSRAHAETLRPPAAKRKPRT